MTAITMTAESETQPIIVFITIVEDGQRCFGSDMRSVYAEHMIKNIYCVYSPASMPV